MIGATVVSTAFCTVSDVFLGYPHKQKGDRQMHKRLFGVVGLLFLLALLFIPAAPAGAQTTSYEWSMVAQATPDECFEGNVNAPGGITSQQMADNNNSFINAYPSGLSSAQIAACASAGYLPKVNQSYVWGLTQDSVGNLWIGTAANVLCLVLDGYYGSVPAPFQNSDYVCDAQQNPMEDFKPPRMFVYNPSANSLTDLTGRILLAGGANVTYLKGTYGIRSAGFANGVVFFGGLYTNTSTTPSTTDVVLYAFNSTTMQYLGAYLFDGTNGKPWYNNIRQWHVINNNLFTGVGWTDTSSGATNGYSNGSLLRWSGSLSNPFSFVDVGDTQGQISYFTSHTDGRIYATTWGGGGKMQGGMLVWMSPVLNASTGLDATDAPNWQQVWNLNSYEVEPSVVAVGGAIQSYKGSLYFGTMQVPGTSILKFQTLYPTSSLLTTTTGQVQVYLNTTLPDTIFRSTGFNAGTNTFPVELLYGSANLEQYQSSTDSFSLVANGMGATPTYGAAGFGNIFNNYTWSMNVFQDQLFVGTMDFSYLVVNSSLGTSIPTLLKTLAAGYYGADLWMFPDGSSAATSVNVNGMGNNTSYGIRTMAADSKYLWLGMANPMNLRTDSTNNPGGWKLIKFIGTNATPIINWTNPVAITYGTPLTATQLNATANVSGAYTYSPPLGTVLSAGQSQTLTVTFVPDNSGGSQFSSSVKLNVNPAPLVVTPDNKTMVYGTTPPALTGTLATVVNSDGITASYSTTPTITSSTAVGTYTITPTLADPNNRKTNYSITSNNAAFTISQAGTVSAITASMPTVLLQNPVTFTANVASTTSGTPTGTVTFYDGSTKLNATPIALASGSAQLAVSSLSAGLHSINYVYSGDTNYLGSTSQVLTETVQDFQFNASAGSITAVTVMPGGVAIYSITIAPSYGSYFPNPVTLTLSGLPSGYTYTMSPTSIPAGSGTTTVTVQVTTSATQARNGGYPTGLTLAVLFIPMLGLIGLRRRLHKAGLLLLMLLALTATLAISGCHGGKTGFFAAQPTTSTLTLTGTSGTLSHSVNLTLTVQ